MKKETYELTECGMVKNRIGRNEPCPCGSGKKHKKCCLNSEAIAGEENAMSKYRFETGSYGVPGGYLPSMACHKRNANGQWSHDYVLVCPVYVFEDEPSAATQAENDLSEAAEKGRAAKSEAVLALALKATGYVLVNDSKSSG